MTRRVLRLTAGLAVGVGLWAAPASGASTPTGGYARVCRAAAQVTSTRSTPGVVAVDAPRALPPTPLTSLAGGVRVAVTAHVVAVLYQDPRPSVPRRPANFVGPIPPQRCQVVRLAVVRTLAGTPPVPLVVVKPRAPYTLRGSRSTHPGTFLLDDAAPYPTILGNYGPDPYDPGTVAAVLHPTG